MEFWKVYFLISTLWVINSCVISVIFDYFIVLIISWSILVKCKYFLKRFIFTLLRYTISFYKKWQCYDKVNIISKWKQIQKPNFYHCYATRYSDGTRIPIKKGNLCYHPTSEPFWKKIDSCKPENKQVIGCLVVLSDIIDEYDVEFLDEQGHIKIKRKGISRS